MNLMQLDTKRQARQEADSGREKVSRLRLPAIEKCDDVAGLFTIQSERQVTQRHIQAYKDKPVRTEETVRYQITVMRNEEGERASKCAKSAGVFIRPMPVAFALSLTDAVLAYRNQYLVEQPLGALKRTFSSSITPFCLCNEMTMERTNQIVDISVASSGFFLNIRLDGVLAGEKGRS
ncbi:MAG: hypothetical protein M5U34_37920 [Chloroflexi bacterium]|nr:hypothetical protein [Chloroflexota bacterium]